MLQTPSSDRFPTSLDQLEREIDNLRNVFAWARDRASAEIRRAMCDSRSAGTDIGGAPAVAARRRELARAVRIFAVADVLCEVAGAVLPTQEPEAVERILASDSVDLSRRERDVVALLVEGRTNKEIAAALGIKETTVASYVTNILDKLGLASRTAVAAYAVRRGLV
jgi:DNA-binding NarL/FixJ family response regulator